MSNQDSEDEITALSIRSAQELSTRSSLVSRGLRDISGVSQEDSFKSLKKRALELFHQGKFEEAISICDAGLDTNQKEECLWLRALKLNLHQGKFDEAISICDTGLDTNPNDECLWLIKGISFRKQDKYEEFLQCAIRLLEIDSQNQEYWWLAATILHRLGRFEEELEYWQKLMEINPQYYGGWKGIGDCLFSLRKHQEAVEAFDAALKADPSDEYCASCKEAAAAALYKDETQLLPKIWSTELIATLIVSVENWQSEASPRSRIAMLAPRFRSFSLVCSFENISDREQIVGKEFTIVQYSPSTGTRTWVGDALIVDSGTMPKKLGVDSEWSAVKIEVTWLSYNRSDLECVQELLTDKYETFGYDDKFGTVLRFV
jgi:tetratricopeptide (TPR) repeat protein